MWNLGGNWWFDAQAQFFQVAIDNIDGSIINYRAARSSGSRSRGSASAPAMTRSASTSTSIGERLDGSLDWTYAGPQVFFNFAF